MPPYPGFRRERFAPAIALGMETGRPSGEAAVAPRFLGSPPPRTQAGEGDDSGPALAPPPRRRLASAEFAWNHSHRDSNVFERCGCLLISAGRLRPGLRSAGFPLKHPGSGPALHRVGRLAGGGVLARSQPGAGPPSVALRPAALLAGSMKVANDQLGKSNPVFSLSTGGVTYNTGAAKASKNGVRCGQVQKALENQANPARPCLSVIVCLSPNSTGFAGFFRFRKHGQHRCILEAFEGGNTSQGEWHGWLSSVAIDPVNGLGKGRSRNS